MVGCDEYPVGRKCTRIGEIPPDVVCPSLENPVICRLSVIYSAVIFCGVYIGFKNIDVCRTSWKVHLPVCVDLWKQKYSLQC